MTGLSDLPIGIYEKALPDTLSLTEKLLLAKEAGYDFLEISIDESDERLKRLDWSKAERLELVGVLLMHDMRISTMCFSAQRRFPFGSHDPAIRQQAKELMRKALEFAVDVGIRTIQLAGYDVFYESGDRTTVGFFLEGLRYATHLAAHWHVMLALETMDTTFMDSVAKCLWARQQVPSPWLSVYPDLGNLHAWHGMCWQELALGKNSMVALHVKETIGKSAIYPGKFRDLLYGQGDVEFAGFFRVLREMGYAGTFVLEFWHGPACDATYPYRALRWMKEQLALCDALENEG